MLADVAERQSQPGLVPGKEKLVRYSLQPTTSGVIDIIGS